MYNTEQIVEKFKKVHGGKYDYSQVVYHKLIEPVKIVCPKHGIFEQSPHAHLKGQGCPLCGVESRVSKRTYNNEKFIKKAREIHGDKYDYSKVEYVNSHTKVCIICPEHGEFWQEAGYHLNGEGCPTCAKIANDKKNTMTQEEFIRRAREIHGDKYDYSKVEYINSQTKVCIICPIHGEFWQLPTHHLMGHGCRKCGDERRGKNRIKSTEEFIRNAKKIHGDKYDYSKVEYVSCHTPVTILCKKHGEFKQKPSDHLNGNGCPLCGYNMSLAEQDIFELCKSCLGEENVLQRVRNVIPPQELDIYIPSLKIAIEYNGLRWHSEEFGKDRQYHLSKMKKCNELGIRLIQIFEDEWILHKDMVISKIRHLLGADNLPKIMARKCVIKEIDKKQSNTFLDENHIQGMSKASVYLGAYYQDKLIGVMTFKKETGNSWELNRFATDNNYICNGVGGKLFTYFVRHYNPSKIKSFADKRWTINENNLYTSIGFVKEKDTPPDYRYVKVSESMMRIHKFNFRKQVLHRKYGLPLSLTESEMTKQLGYFKIWDCGLIKYVWNKKTTE
jgi:hypothetical protein